MDEDKLKAKSKEAADAADAALEAAKGWNVANLDSTKIAKRVTAQALREKVQAQVGLEIGEIRKEILQLNEQLNSKPKEAGSAHSDMPAVLDEETKRIDSGQLRVNPELNASAADEPSRWTQISVKVSRS